MILQSVEQRAETTVDTPLRICLITSKHTIRDSRVFGCFYQGIERAGGEVTVIGPSADQPGEDRDLRSIGLPVLASPNEETLGSLRLTYERIKALVHLFRWCLSLRPDIIQACDPDSWVVAWLAARLYGGRAVFDVHEMFPAYLAGRLPARNCSVARLSLAAATRRRSLPRERRAEGVLRACRR